MHVVAGVGFSERAETVARVAARLARRLGLPLALVHVEPPPIGASAPHVGYAAPWLDVDRDLIGSRLWLERLAAGSGAEDAELRVEVGRPARRLLDASRDGAALLVVGAPHAVARLGTSVAGALRAAAACPVLVVPRTLPAETKGDDMDTGPILCGVDGSPDSEAALRAAAELSGRLGAPLVVAHVAQPAPLAATPDGRAGGAAQLDAARASGERLLQEMTAQAGIRDAKLLVAAGIPAERLAELADDEGAELVVVGSRGRGAFRAAFLGSVSNELIGVARCPVLVVPPGAQEYWAPWQHASPASRSHP